MRSNIPLNKTARLAICGLVLVGLAGCASTTPKPPVPGPTEHFALKAEEVPDQLALGVHAEGLSGPQQAALSDFVARWREAGCGPVLLRTPADVTAPDQARSMTYAVQSQLQAMGVPTERIQLAAYNAGMPRAPVLASFERLAAKIADCSGGWDNLTSTIGNEPYKHFGCAQTANMAAMIADPHDLVSPPDLAPADNVRRQVVLGKYRDGKITASDKDVQASGAVSSAVQQ